MSSSDSDEGREYEVEAIKGRRVHNNKIQYFIKWKGWPDLSNTWQDEEDLTGCKELLKKFLTSELLKKQVQKNTAKTILKINGTVEKDGQIYVVYVLSDKTTRHVLYSKAIHDVPDLLFQYLEKHAVFRVET